MALKDVPRMCFRDFPSDLQLKCKKDRGDAIDFAVPKKQPAGEKFDFDKLPLSPGAADAV